MCLYLLQDITGPGQSVSVLISRGCLNKVPHTGDVNNGLCPHSSRGWKSKIKVLAGLVPSEASLVGLLMTIFSLCPHMVLPLCVSVS